MAPAGCIHLLHLSLLFLLSFSSPPRLAVAQGMPDLPDIPLGVMDAVALLFFKKSLGNPAVLSSWVQGVDPCGKKVPPWAGVVCTGGVITGMRLGGMGLSGTLNDTAIETLTHIRGLRTISLSDNSLSGDILPFGHLIALKSLFLSNNHFSGTIEDGFFANMGHLKKLWLSGNSFTGRIPSSLSKLSHLMELRLENNQFSGGIPAMNIPTLKSFNVSNNLLQGEIPAGLVKFGAGAFLGNPALCDPKASMTCKPAPDAPAPSGNGNEVMSGRTVLVGIVLGILLLALAAGVVVARRRREGDFDTLGVEQHGGGESVSVNMPPPAGGSSHKSHSGSSKRNSGSSHKRPDSSRGGSSWGGDGHAELVMVSQEKAAFGLPDLMKAAAEVLGNGGLGSAYKAVMANGVAVVVKRMRDLNRIGKEGFEVEMRRHGRLHHPNVLTPLAYHYRKEEKLIILEYVEKGSLLYALHGDRGSHHAALDWPTRLKIVRGITRGMTYLHAELASSDVPHGDLKSSNVLLGPDYEALLVDYGFTPLVNPSQASVAMFAYRSPEAVQHRQVSAKSDVYCLGVVILEVVTGKFPSQYLSNGKGGTDVVEWALSAVAERREAELVDPEIAAGSKAALASMERLLRVGAACVEPRPEMRPDMREAARRVEGVAAEGDDEVARPPSQKHAELTTRLSARESAGENFGIS